MIGKSYYYYYLKIMKKSKKDRPTYLADAVNQDARRSRGLKTERKKMIDGATTGTDQGAHFGPVFVSMLNIHQQCAVPPDAPRQGITVECRRALHAVDEVLLFFWLRPKSAL
jgi:hypothetical protein